MRSRIVIATAVILCDLVGIAWTIYEAREITSVCFYGPTGSDSDSGCHQTGSRLAWGVSETLWIGLAVASLVGLALFLSRGTRRWLALAAVGAITIAAPIVVTLVVAVFNDSGRYHLL